MGRRERDPERERHWRRHLEQQRTSGLTARAYCRAHGLAETAFHYWQRTIAERDRQGRRSAATPAFVPVTVVDTPRAAGPRADTAIDIRLAGGHRLRVRAGCDRELLAAALAALGGRPC